MNDLLDRWQRRDVLLADSIRSLVEAQSNRYSNDHQAFQNLRKTILLTIGYATQLEQSDDIPTGMFDELKRTTVGEDGNILRYFCRYVLPLLLSKHLQQASELIPALTRYRAHHDDIAHGLAQIYASQSE